MSRGVSNRSPQLLSIYFRAFTLPAGICHGRRFRNYADADLIKIELT